MNCRKCRHCLRAPVNRPRGLCWKCFYTPDVRVLYPSKVRHGVRDGYGHRPPPPEPTQAWPGTPEKVDVLCRRAEQRCQLWHPRDAG
jgi:hypothetical protein